MRHLKFDNATQGNEGSTMNFIRRVLMVLGIAGIAGALLRVRGKSEPSSQRGGWRPLNPTTDSIVDQTSSQN
jgi:hypothetical protein